MTKYGICLSQDNLLFRRIDILVSLATLYLSINVGPSKFQRETALTGKLSLNIDRETVFLVSYVIDGETYPFCNYSYENNILCQKPCVGWKKI